jgi:hypothetical protein
MHPTIDNLFVEIEREIFGSDVESIEISYNTFCNVLPIVFTSSMNGLKEE